MLADLGHFIENKIVHENREKLSFKSASSGIFIVEKF
jgi:hypothetical protein